MLTDVDVANNALAYLSSSSISSLIDNTDEKSRVINSVFSIVSQEVMRNHRWSCCIKRAKLSELADAPDVVGDFGYRHAFQLPVDCLRFLDLNGEPYKSRTEELDINGRALLTNNSEARIRYVAHIKDVGQWDVLMAEAISIKLAMRIARRITKDGVSSEQLNGLYQQAISNAQKVDAMEVGSGENSPLERMLERSPMLKQGRIGAQGLGSILGYNVDSSEQR